MGVELCDTYTVTLKNGLPAAVGAWWTSPGPRLSRC